MEPVTLCVWQGLVYVEVVRENGTCYPVCVAGAGVCGGGKREWNLLSCVCGRGWYMWRWRQPSPTWTGTNTRESVLNTHNPIIT